MSTALCRYAEFTLDIMGAPQRFWIQTDSDVVAARRFGRELAGELGFTAMDGTLVATAISELARNILIHAGCGEITVEVRHNSPVSLVITASDQGPGIPDIDMALRDGYSTYGGLGLGLPGTRRVMDEFEIRSRPGGGTTVVVKKILRPM